ncbi:MAG: hypothetical protein MHM6MM_000558 [Cercozoa sp. M6MM]
MGFSIFGLIKVLVLLANALAILHEKRFLKKYGMDQVDQNDHSAKARFVGVLFAARTVARPLLMFVNVIIIVLELLVG